jgi:hypothetical protein
MSAMFAAAMSAVVMAQSGGSMEKNPSMSKMDKMAVRATYTGCLEAGSAAGAFNLTHADRMSSDSMKKDAMAKDAMGRDMMAPASLSLAGSSVNLRNYVGRKVSVTGSASAMHKDAAGMDVSTFTVKSLRVLAASCQ